MYKSFLLLIVRIFSMQSSTTSVAHLCWLLQDPFNREHLTNNMLEPQSELKERIQNFLKQKRAEAKARRQ